MMTFWSSFRLLGYGTSPQPSTLWLPASIRPSSGGGVRGYSQ